MVMMIKDDNVGDDDNVLYIYDGDDDV